jgi:class 3 adenylate cyclase
LPGESATADLLTGARDALGRHAWAESFDLFQQADQENQLSGADLKGLADAAFFTGQSVVAVEILERAFQAFQATGDKARAADVAFNLQTQYSYRAKPSIAAAWMRRGEKLLDGEPENFAHGYLNIARAFAASGSGDLEAALQHFDLAAEIGTRTNNPDLRAMALSLGGYMRVGSGALADGFAMMEEAAIAAVNGELSPFTAGVSCCNMISCCRDLTDYERATEWIEATEKFCERQSVSGFPGVCRVHKAEVVALSGAWAKAEAELRRATTELAAFNAAPPMADGFYAIGEIRLRMGDLEGAEDGFRQAHSLGKSPQPGLARVRLAQGKGQQAASAVKTALAESILDRVFRTRLLPAAVEIFIAVNDVAAAREAAMELEQLVETFDSPAMQAVRHDSWGRVLLAEGDSHGAIAQLRDAISKWRKLSAPYEVARSQVLLSMALRATDDVGGADLELAAARDTFANLGASGSQAEVEKAIQAINERQSKPVQVWKTFLFTDIVGSTNLAGLLGDEAWQHLLQWHDDALRTQFARSGGEVINSTGDGFFVAFDLVERGVESAIAIQRALVEHRRTTGFAPSVRIGLHAAEANRNGADFSGIGVHVAARVAGLAGSGEIFASAETARAAALHPLPPGVRVSEPRLTTLKGVTDPVEIVTILWGESPGPVSRSVSE